MNNAIEHCLNVIEKDKVMFCDPQKPLMIINCQDGARHDLTHKKETNVFTSSICMLSECSVNKHKVFLSNQNNILTTNQANCKENYEKFVALKLPFYQAMANRDLLTSLPPGVAVDWVMLHDGKMLHLILQHSLWNQKKRPFLLCKCTKGAGVRCNDNHQCKMWKHQDHTKHCNKSKKNCDAWLKDPNNR